MHLTIKPEQSLAHKLDGVNLAGFLTAESGLGESARGMASAINHLGIKLSLTDFPHGNPSRKLDKRLKGFTTLAPYLVNLICITPLELPAFFDYVGNHYFENKFNIGSWWWELPEFPKELSPCFDYFDEIWTGTTFIHDAINKSSKIPVVIVPPVVEISTPLFKNKEYFGLRQDEYTFIYVYSYFSSGERKNPLGIIRAFRKAFSSSENVRLVLKSTNSEQDRAMERKIAATIGDARVTTIGTYISRGEVNGLINSCDCYVSLHRSEGFGLTLAEAMLLQKPVIATAWSGNMDFMTNTNSYPVQYHLTKIKKQDGPYKVGQLWADPEIDHAANLMRNVYLNQEEALRKGQQAALDIEKKYSAKAVSVSIHDRLRLISPLNQTPLHKRAKLPEFSPNGYLGMLAKRVMKRLIRFQTIRQDAINRHLIQSNYELAESTEQFKQDTTREISELKEILRCLINEIRHGENVDIALLDGAEKRLESLQSEIDASRKK